MNWAIVIPADICIAVLGDHLRRGSVPHQQI